MSEQEIPANSNGNIEEKSQKEISPITGPDGEIVAPTKKSILKDKISAKATPAEILEAVLGASQDELMPWEPTALPSMGLYYNGGIPDGKIEVKPMGLYADKVLATTRLAQSGFSIDYLFKYCVRFPSSFDPLDLTLGDRVFLLYYLRGITHGNEYEFSVTCTNDDCKRVSTHMYDLNRLWNTVRWPNINTQKEPFKVILPYLTESVGREFWIHVRLLRGRDAQHILQRQKVVNQVTGGPRPAHAESEEKDVQKQLETYTEVNIDQTIEQNLNLVIIDVMGDSNRNKVQQFVAKMHARDTATVREFLRDNTPGIDTALILECPHCTQDLRMELPITESFFRPTGGRRAREGVGTSDGAIVPT